MSLKITGRYWTDISIICQKRITSLIYTNIVFSFDFLFTNRKRMHNIFIQKDKTTILENYIGLKAIILSNQESETKF